MRSRARLCGSRRGVALAVVVLLTAALAVLAHAAFVLARTEGLVARGEARRMEAAYRAAAALAWLERRADTLPPTGLHVTPRGSVDVVRLTAEVSLLRAPLEGLPSGESRARILFSPDVGVRVIRPSALILGGGIIRQSRARVEPAPDSSVCPPGVGPPGPMAVWGWSVPDSPHPALGPIDLERLLVRLPALPPGRARLDGFTVGGGTGSLTLEAEGSGLIAVRGDLVVGRGAVLTGWVWVGGDLRVEEGATFAGMADVGGRLHVADGARVIGDPCAAARALVAAPVLRRPWGVGPWAWPSS